jgi:hypothetical protein
MDDKHNLAVTLDRPWEETVSARLTVVSSPASPEGQGVTEAGSWVRDTATGAVEQLEQWIEEYPWPTVLIGFGLGFLLARRTRS